MTTWWRHGGPRTVVGITLTPSSTFAPPFAVPWRKEYRYSEPAVETGKLAQAPTPLLGGQPQAQNATAAPSNDPSHGTNPQPVEKMVFFDGLADGASAPVGATARPGGRVVVARLRTTHAVGFPHAGGDKPRPYDHSARAAQGIPRCSLPVRGPSRGGNSQRTVGTPG